MNRNPLLGLLVLIPLAAAINVSPSPSVASSKEVSNAQTIDITEAILTNRSGNCADYVASYRSESTDESTNISYTGALTVRLEGDTCLFMSNAVPNHDFNDAGGFANAFSEQNQTYRITTNPQRSNDITRLSLDYDTAILLNGVKVDLIAAACYRIRDEKTGCDDMETPWRFDPMWPGNEFNTDSHNAHTQPDGAYHYHGNPLALFDAEDDSSVSPVIGFAADGFPIFGPYFDDSGNIRKALSSYQLRSGSRPSGRRQPGGAYDGTFINDYEYVEGSGDLDRCNGMTIDGVYGYYVTDSYPHVLGCFRGAPHPSFRKRGGAPTGNSRPPGGGRRPRQQMRLSPTEIDHHH